MSAVLLGFLFALHLLLRDSTVLMLSRKTYAIAGGAAGLYALTGLLVWAGAPLGYALNQVCSLLYFVRPPLGVKVATLSRGDEFKAHFQRSRGTNAQP